VLLGDYLYIKSMNMALAADDLEVIKILAEITLKMIEGELIADRQTGCLVPKGDIAAVASRIVELHSDLLRRRTMGRRAREALLREFSLGRYIQDVHKLYDSLLVGVRAQR